MSHFFTRSLQYYRHGGYIFLGRAVRNESTAQERPNKSKGRKMSKGRERERVFVKEKVKISLFWKIKIGGSTFNWKWNDTNWLTRNIKSFLSERFFFCLFFSCVKLLPWILLVGGSKSNLLSFYRKVIVHFHKGKRREIKSNNWKTEKTGDRDRIRALKMSIEWTTPPHPTSRCCCFNNALIVRSKQSTQHTNSTR